MTSYGTVISKKNTGLVAEYWEFALLIIADINQSFLNRNAEWVVCVRHVYDDF